MKDGFIKIAAGTPAVKVADIRHNTAAAVDVARAARREGTHVLVLPELCLTGYTCGDLFEQDILLDEAKNALVEFADLTRSMNMLIFAGLPVRHGGKLYNCAAAVFGGTVLGLVPKSYIPNYGEFYEGRWFSPAPETVGTIDIGDKVVPFGVRLLFRCDSLPELCVACEICEDLWVASPPSVSHCLAGANVIVNLSASNEIAGKAEYRRSLAVSQSARLICAYAYADAGIGESTTDVVFSGHNIICENGVCLSEAEPFSDREIIISAVDLQHLAADRRYLNTCAAESADGYETIYFPLKYEPVSLNGDSCLTPAESQSHSYGGYFVDPHPFVPADRDARDKRCGLIMDIQTRGLSTRYEAAHAGGFTIAISGGLDSCLALLVAARAADRLGLGRECIEAVTMPCFGTTGRTRKNAEKLCRLLGVRFRCIDIADAVSLHFKDIGHDPGDQNVVYENSQARERTQILFDIANESGSLVVGTGDLSELALGFATYNGDHMSSYAVNADVPKTLVRYLVRYYAERAEADGEVELSAVLLDILDTPVSPELLPADENGNIEQRTEELVGPYELHDFFLYRMLRFKERPGKIFRMAKLAFAGEYTPDEIKKWMKMFFRRFFAQQFKRSCLPDGPKVGSAALSPRGDWRMPSDASSALWLSEIEEL